MDRGRFVTAMVAALVRRPVLVPVAVRQLLRLAPTGWWRRAPFLPLPPGDYVEFRQVTSTGRGDTLPDVDEVITWLEWCRSARTWSS